MRDGREDRSRSSRDSPVSGLAQPESMESAYTALHFAPAAIRTITSASLVASTLPAGLAQTFEHMVVVSKAKPRKTCAHEEIEGVGCNCDGSLQCVARVASSAKLAE